MSRLPVPIAQINRRLPEAGRIRTGKKTATRNGREAPTALREFRFTSHDREALDQVADMYGGEVKSWSEPKAAPGQFELLTSATEIRVVLPPDPLGGTPVYERWSGGGCDRRCDGLICTTQVQGPEGPEPTEVGCLCAAAGEMSCDVKVRLNVLLPEVRFVGTWRLESKSWNAAQELPGMVDMIQSLQGQGLSYATLTLQPRKSVSGGETHNFVIPVLGIPASLEQLAAGASQLQSLGTGGAASSAPALGAGESSVEEPPGVTSPGSGDRDAVPSASQSGGELGSTQTSPSDPDDEIADAEIVDDEPDPAPAPAATTQDGHATGSNCSLCGQPYGTDRPLVKGHAGESRYVHRDCRSVEPISESEMRGLFAELRKREIGSPERHAWVSTVLGREVSSFNEVSSADLVAIRAWFESNPAGEVVAS